jgi:hypothetical protein
MKTLTKILGASALALTIAGCNLSKDYSNAELAKAQVSTNSIDQVFVNTVQQVFIIQVASDGRVTQDYLGRTREGYLDEPYVKIYKDLSENDSPYFLQYRKGDKILENEVHVKRSQNMMLPSERVSNGKSTYEVNNIELTK